MNPPSLKGLFPLSAMSGVWDVTVVSKRPVRAAAEGSLALWPGGEHLREAPQDLFGRTTVRYLWFGGIAADFAPLHLDTGQIPVAVEDSTYLQLAVSVDSTNARMTLAFGNDHQRADAVLWVVEYKAGKEMRGVLAGGGQGPEPRIEGYFCAVFRNAV